MASCLGLGDLIVRLLLFAGFLLGRFARLLLRGLDRVEHRGQRGDLQLAGERRSPLPKCAAPNARSRLICSAGRSVGSR